MSNGYFGAPGAESNAEPVNSIETEDFSRFTTMTPGNYINPARSAEATANKVPGHYTVVLTFDGGFVDGDGRSHAAGKYPLKKWISTVPFKVKTRDGSELPGMTSSVAEYLRACGVSPKGLTPDTALEAIQSTLSTPLGVYIGRTDKGVKNPDTGKYESLGLKTQDFNTGTKDAPVWAEQVERDGRVFRAAPRITSFTKVSA